MRQPPMSITSTPATPAMTLPAKVKARWVPLLLSAGLALCLTAADAQTREKKTKTKKTKPPATQARAKPSVKVTHQPSPSEESRAERERRLYRECQGRPNAGACLGYTRKP
ncbi:hypothetical protein D8B34_11415 [Verminephrobacter eiseniae]|uniref:hypothetical protein n=2 Tax=Verminephrobacter eiseniae TaxID=364317 RepID=UPI0010CE0D45|nr:hypothetical protein [Verminephrobacter eiseniae]KAB7603839.1 hypothetical protein ET532_011060 [Verminephrobacter sp. Larva24]MCW5230596.1 hypothetical protein [Verminephrobacter eiseniae]MCW5292329.1 hypothetical protein [Verminephrobacter eiseniae]MCW8183339.1 hypothetical protein [Verminephrobacter eiseniae]MCW8223093.1 hypothetical protein [Verminephrobacter eiseniae]